MIDNALLLKRIESGDNSAFDEMVSSNMALVKSVARSFSGRGCEDEDLVQIGSIGLIKAIRKFDESFGVMFSTYAVPMIAGEIRRFLRDDGLIKVSRAVKETANKGRKAQEILRKELGRDPTIGEVSSKTGNSCENLAYAFEACGKPESINAIAADTGKEFSDAGKSGSCEERTIDRLLVSEALNLLDRKERMVIVLRYLHQLPQSEIAPIIGVSQVQISRIEKKALEKIRKKMSM